MDRYQFQPLFVKPTRFKYPIELSLHINRLRENFCSVSSTRSTS